jgi:colicin import membrane protein
MEAMAAQQSHEAQLVALRSDQTKKRLKLIVGLVSAVLVLGVVGGVMAYSNAQAEHQKQQQILLAEQQRSAAELARLKSDFDAAQKKEEELRHTLESAKDEATRAKIEAELAKAKQDTETARGRVGTPRAGGGGASKPAGGAAKPCNCPPGDPLCSCL